MAGRAGEVGGGGKPDQDLGGSKVQNGMRVAEDKGTVREGFLVEVILEETQTGEGPRHTAAG